MQKELTTEQKWQEVDRLVAQINERRAKGNEIVHYSELDEYVDHHFNK